MSVLDELEPANLRVAAESDPPAPLPAQPGRQLALVSCMDCRLDLLGNLGLSIGDAHVLRNAGGLVTQDVLRSLAISQHKLGTRSVAVIHHTGCGMSGFDDPGFRAELAAASGATPEWDVPGFTDLSSQVRQSLALVRDCPWLPYRDDVRGFVYDVATGLVNEVR